MPILDDPQGMPPGFQELYEILCQRLDALEQESELVTRKNIAGPQWTGSLAWLNELIYSLKEAGVINNGNITVSEIALALQQAFNIAIGNIYRRQQENRLRHDPTPFLDLLKAKYMAYINRIDDNPHSSTR